MNNNFEKDLEDGKVGERAVRHLWKTNGAKFNIRYRHI